MKTQYEVEIWKPITGFEGKYAVSSKGRVKSLDRVTKSIKTFKKSGKQILAERKLKGRMLKPQMDKEGYYHVRLYVVGSHPVLYKIHQLVAQEFLGYNRSNTESMVVDHIDNDRRNNNLNNLRVISRIENITRGQAIKMEQRRMPKQIIPVMKGTIILNEPIKYNFASRYEDPEGVVIFYV